MAAPSLVGDLAFILPHRFAERTEYNGRWQNELVQPKTRSDAVSCGGRGGRTAGDKRNSWRSNPEFGRSLCLKSDLAQTDAQLLSASEAPR